MTQSERDQMAFEIKERAAIREFDGGESRKDAERNARIEVVKAWKEKKEKAHD